MYFNINIGFQIQILTPKTFPPTFLKELYNMIIEMIHYFLLEVNFN
jgi:hypothetical protein